MKLQFWGTRGSIAKSNAQVLRYGGHTSCVEIRSEANDLLILDAGTGLHGLSQQLIREQKPLRSASILISHTHWDHIQGLPFFAPFFFPNMVWNIYGPPTLSQDLESILGGQMQKTYFPITQEIFNAQINYHNLTEGEFSIGDIHVQAHYLNHPGVTLGYRIMVDGHTVVYSTDHEPHDCRLAHGGLPQVGSEDERHARFLSGADFVIHDTQYLAEEYERYRGWGHSTMEYVVDLAQQADVHSLVLFHHDPMRSDQEVDQIVNLSRERAQRRAGAIDIWAAAEQQPLYIPPRVILPSALHRSLAQKQDHNSSPIIQDLSQDNELIMCIGETRTYSEAVKLSGNRAELIANIEIAISQQEISSPKIVFIDTAAMTRLGELYQPVGEPHPTGYKPQLVLFCEADEFTSSEHQERYPGLIRMVSPVSDIYLSSRIETWLRRMESDGVTSSSEATAVQEASEVKDWERGAIPSVEAERLTHVAHVLKFVKNPVIHRHLSALCEILWRALMVPSSHITRVSLNIIDAQTQQSIITFPIEKDSLENNTCSRDQSICSHVVAYGSSLSTTYHAEDQLLKSYAHFTSTSSTEILRSYIGYPIKIEGYCVGTLCCYSLNDIHLQPGHHELIASTTTLLEEALTQVN